METCELYCNEEIYITDDTFLKFKLMHIPLPDKQWLFETDENFNCRDELKDYKVHEDIIEFDKSYVGKHVTFLYVYLYHKPLKIIEYGRLSYV